MINSKNRNLIAFIINYKYSIIILLLLSTLGFIYGLNVVYDFARKICKVQCTDTKISLLQLIATAVAGYWALILYIQKNQRDKNKYLKIYLEVSEQTDVIKVLTKLSNDTQSKRKLQFACLIITLKSEFKNSTTESKIKRLQEDIDMSYLQILTKEFKICIEYSTHIKKLEKFGIRQKNNFLFIPLKYYTSENLKISNEDLTYEFSFEKSTLSEGIYDVRFFVFPSSYEFPNMERVVHKSLIIKN